MWMCLKMGRGPKTFKALALHFGLGAKVFRPRTHAHISTYVFMTWLTILAAKQFSFSRFAIKMGNLIDYRSERVQLCLIEFHESRNSRRLSSSNS